MKNLNRLGAAIVLTFALGLSAYAQTPLCAPPAPGQLETPPCSGGQTPSDNSETPGIATPPASDQEYLAAEAVISLFESLLPIF